MEDAAKLDDRATPPTDMRIFIEAVAPAAAPPPLALRVRKKFANGLSSSSESDSSSSESSRKMPVSDRLAAALRVEPRGPDAAARVLPEAAALAALKWLKAPIRENMRLARPPRELMLAVKSDWEEYMFITSEKDQIEKSKTQ